MASSERLNEVQLVIDDVTKYTWLSSLVDNIFKILPTYEERGYVATQLYLGVLLMDMTAANRLFDGCLSDVIVKLYVIYNQDSNHKEIRKRVLECTSLVRKKVETMYGKQEN